MTIGRHECRQARNCNFQEALGALLDEALTALEESFHDLTDPQLAAFPLPGRNNVAWIVMHALQNLNEYANVAQGGEPISTVLAQPRWDLWQCQPEERPGPGDTFPSKARMLNWLRALRPRAEEALARIDEAYLTSKPPGRWPGNYADMYLRTICHTTAHVRQIWVLRGAQGLVSAKTWPQQHWA